MMRIGSDTFINASQRIQPTQHTLDIRISDEPESKASSDLFKLVFEASSKAYEEASAVSRANTEKLLTGEIEDLAAYMVEAQKPGILLDLNLSMRNKILDAYSEIMKTQV